MNRWITPALSLLGLLAALSTTNAQEAKPLFDGKTLKGWVQHGGKAAYTIENGEIVGTSVVNTPNSFLCTEKPYRDFVLEVDFKVDPALNSGVQIRSNVYEKPTTFEGAPASAAKAKQAAKAKASVTANTIPAGRVHGYQVEIDPSDRAWTGGIYDEGRRGWLNTLEKNEQARKAFKQNEWNHFKVECQGDHIRTWLNGVAAADLKDGMTREGFISLQVHSVGNKPENAGKQVRWKNIMIQELPTSATTSGGK